MEAVVSAFASFNRPVMPYTPSPLLIGQERIAVAKAEEAAQLEEELRQLAEA